MQTSSICLPRPSGLISRVNTHTRPSLCCPPRALPPAVVGIDLGTTNSAIAVVQDGRPAIVPIPPEQGRTLPSVVSLTADSTPLTGVPAQKAGPKRPKDTFYSSKRFIGQLHHQLDPAALRKVALEVGASEDGAVVFDSSTGPITPEQVAAIILRRLLSALTLQGLSQPTRAVISVPAYFDARQRAATQRAGQLAGLETVKLIREPVAAALAYGINAQQDQTVLVLDLGGGTFDVSLLEVGGGVIEVLATGGDPQLGGDDWDNAIVAWLGANHLAPLGLDWRRPAVLSMLRTLAERAKVQLSESMRVSMQIPIPASKAPRGPDGAPQTPLEVTLTRGQLEKLSVPLYRRMRDALDSACWQAGVDLGQVIEQQDKPKGKPEKGLITPKGRLPVSQVLLVGGATRMPGMRQLVRNMTGIDARQFVVDPDEAVALGAAVQAGIYEGAVPGVTVMDVWQAALARAFAADRLAQADHFESDSDDDF